MAMISDIEFTDNSDEILELLGQAKLNGLTAIGMKAETYAKEDCPVDTGRLRNSIAHAVDDEKEAAEQILPAQGVRFFIKYY